MPRALTAAALLAATALAGCGGDEETTKPIEGPAKDVAATVQAFERATQQRDYAAICRDLFAPAVRKRAGAGRCTALLRRTAGDVRDPRIRIRKISISGDRATVAVTTSASGQAPVADSIELTRVGGRWRISELSR